MPRPGALRAVALSAALLASASCSATSATTAPSTSTATTATTATSYLDRPDSGASFGWGPTRGGLQSGHLTVPMDVDHPDAGTFSLFVERHLARLSHERIGSLLVNPGGPGYGGTDLVESAESVYGTDVLDHFDIVGWDPRGTGRSEPAVDCVDEYDPFFSLDSSPDNAAEQQAIVDAATTFGADCEAHSGAILPFISTEDSARDMDAIRNALQEETISYFGFSYGSELGVTWASLYPDTVRAMVIDGAADQTVGYLQQNLQQAAGFESTFDAFLADCARRTDCVFHNGGDPADAYDALSVAADGDPVRADDGRPDINQGVLTTAVADALYSPSYWPQLAKALDDLQHGDGIGVLALYDDYYGRSADGSYDDALEAYFAINCLDDPGSKDPQAVFAMQQQFADVAPRLGASWILELEFCASWPVPAAPPVAVDARGAGPVVVVGTTGDPATPLAGTRHQSEALEDGRLIVVTANQHTGYGANECVDRAVDAYLVDLTVPIDELQCAG